jgi:adenine-specific DNA-methyltransferase
LTTANKELLTALRESFPQLFSSRSEDGETVERLDLEKIRLLAGEGNYSDRYGLRWENKPERFDAESVGKLPSLKHVASKSIRTDATKPTHVLIQGDNYHALKVLAYTHKQSVDVIYIDPRRASR